MASEERVPVIPGLRRDGFLRKEVIQPQVPLRLPCYALVPITELAFGAASLRLAHALRVQVTSMM